MKETRFYFSAASLLLVRYAVTAEAERASCNDSPFAQDYAEKVVIAEDSTNTQLYKHEE